MDRNLKGPLCGVAMALIWGLSFLSIKVAVREVPPMTMAVARFVIACAVLPLVARLVGERLRVRLRDLIGVSLYFYGENHGVALLSASESSLVIAFIPVLSVLAERMVHGTRLAARVYLGSALSTAGVVLVVARSGGGTGSRLGFLYMLVACLAWVAYGLLNHGTAERHGMITISFWNCLFGLAGCIPPALAERGQWCVPGPSAILNVVFLGVFCSAAGYWLYLFALKHMGSGRASIFVNLIPVVSVVAAGLLLGERLAPAQWLGGGVVLAGVFLATVPLGWGNREAAAA